MHNLGNRKPDSGSRAGNYKNDSPQRTRNLNEQKDEHKSRKRNSGGRVSAIEDVGSHSKIRES